MNPTFSEIITEKESEYGLALTPEIRFALARYHSQVIESNPLLHLVAPCSEEEFAMRHVLESLTMLELLPRNALITDVGAGAGLPSLPCLIARRDLRGRLIESKPKKVEFLRAFCVSGNLNDRVHVVERQFEEAERPREGFVVCRALDKFTVRLPKIAKWAAGRDFVFFGGPSLRESLEKEKIGFAERLLPNSEQRLLFWGRMPARIGR